MTILECVVATAHGRGIQKRWELVGSALWGLLMVCED